MDKKVIVTLKSKQAIDNREEEFELVTPGKLYKKQDSYFIVYDETEISGMEGTTTTLKVQNEYVNLIRFGATRSNLKFKKGIKDVSLYKTPYGVIELTIKPSLVSVDVDDNGGDVLLLYELDSGGGQISKNELHIKITETNANK